MTVLISDFRLRSGSAAFWVGAMAGADRLAVRVTVQTESGLVTVAQALLEKKVTDLFLIPPTRRNDQRYHRPSRLPRSQVRATRPYGSARNQ